jgi:hypothetical protein
VQNGSGATFNIAPVPEPTSLLALAGLTAVLIRRRGR